jgi:5-methylcytosine-specific restriction endonuclease McrA
MFVYCTDVLHLSEHEAYLRIAVARAARAHPDVLPMLADGRLHLAGIAKLAPHLTPENRVALLARAVHKTKRQIEEIVAELAPRPDAPSLIRRLPDRPLATDSDTQKSDVVPAGTQDAESRLGPDRVEPLAPARYRVQFTADAALRDKLDRLRVLMRSEVPDGDLAAIIGTAVTEKLERLEAKRHATVRAPRSATSTTAPTPLSRHIPAAVRRAVNERDGSRCSYRDPQGRRCPERVRLEYHHRHPYGLGGGHHLDNVCLMCPAHNRYLAELDYGRDTMARHASASRSRAPTTARRGPSSGVSPRAGHAGTSGPPLVSGRLGE